MGILRLESQFLLFESLEKKMGIYLGKKCDMKFSPWTWIGITHHRSLQKLSKICPAYATPFLSGQVFSDLSTVETPSEMLVIPLLPRNKLVAGKQMNSIRGKRTCIKGISAVVRVRG